MSCGSNAGMETSAPMVNAVVDNALFQSSSHINQTISDHSYPALLSGNWLSRLCSLLGWCLTALFQHKQAVSCHRSTIYLVQGTRHIRHNNETIHMTEKVINALWPGLCEDNLLNTNRLPRCLSSQSFDKY